MCGLGWEGAEEDAGQARCADKECMLVEQRGSRWSSLLCSALMWKFHMLFDARLIPGTASCKKGRRAGKACASEECGARQIYFDRMSITTTTQSNWESARGKFGT